MQPRGEGKSQGKKQHMNINKFAGLSRDWVGAKKVVYVSFFIPYGGEKTHNIKQNPPKSRDSPVNILFMYFFFMCFSRSQTRKGTKKASEVV